MQVPAAEVKSRSPDTEQGPELTVNELAPEPFPPWVVKDKVEPYVTEFVLIVRALV
jgi:hypothetical protein